MVSKESKCTISIKHFLDEDTGGAEAGMGDMAQT